VRPLASTTVSARSSSPERSLTPTTRRGPAPFVTSPATALPTRSATFGSASTTRRSTPSKTGRRARSVTSSSSPGFPPPSGARSASDCSPIPAASIASTTSGACCFSSVREWARNPWMWWPWGRPGRCQSRHIPSASAGGGS
jgi:hypothetical protein